MVDGIVLRENEFQGSYFIGGGGGGSQMAWKNFSRPF